MRRQARFQDFGPDQIAQTSDPFYGGGSTGTPEASLQWAQSEFDAGRPINNKVYNVKDGKVSFTNAFNPGITWKDAAPALMAAGGLGIGALMGTGIGAGTAGSAAAGGSGINAAPLTPMTRDIAAPLIGAKAPTVGGAAAGAAKGGGFLSNLMKPNNLIDIGKGISSIGQSQASNRGVALDAQMEADKMRMAQDQQRRDDEAHIWKMLQAVNYIKGGGAPKSGPVMSASGKPFTSYDFGPRAINQGDKDMATTLEAQLLKRLQTVPQLRNYDSKMKPGKVEKATNWLGPLLGIGGMLFGKR